MQGYEVRKNDRGAWCAYRRGELISDHATRDGAVAAARNLMAADVAATTRRSAVMTQEDVQ